jgi:hypothetical protein
MVKIRRYIWYEKKNPNPVLEIIERKEPLKLKIYLAGQMSENYETFLWRKNVEKYINQLPREINKKINILNPFRNKRSIDFFVKQDIIKERVPLDDSVSVMVMNTDLNERRVIKKKIKESNIEIVPIQDAGYVKESNMCIVNMTHYTEDKPMIGTFFELSLYCFMYPSKPVIGIFNGDISKDYQCSFPFVDHAVHTWVKNEIEAIELVMDSYFVMEV